MQDGTKADTLFQPKLSSITHQRHFDLLSKKGLVFSRYGIKIVSLQPVSDFPENTVCLGFKISKQCGNAVLRNKIRRRIKAILRESIMSNKVVIRPQQALLFIPRKQIMTKSYFDLRRTIMNGLYFFQHLSSDNKM